MVKTYYLLTKPGIIMGNTITAAGGFALASRGNIDYRLFFATVLGLIFIIASACVFNNYADRGIDKKMKRTQNRALVKGLISGPNALFYATILGIVGVIILAIFTNYLALLTALLGFFVYVVLYTFWKRKSVHGTVVGSISGAVPPVVGYVAVSGRLDRGAVLFFLILVLWQMPHFFSIAIYRFKDYVAASIPVLPVKKGMQKTKINMLLYIIAFIFAASTLTIFNYTGYIYLAVVLLLSSIWLWQAIKGFSTNDDDKWAKQMFRISLFVITGLCIMIPIDVVKG